MKNRAKWIRKRLRMNRRGMEMIQVAILIAIAVTLGLIFKTQRHRNRDEDRDCGDAGADFQDTDHRLCRGYLRFPQQCKILRECRDNT